MCLADSETNRTCAENLDTMKMAKISPLPIFQMAYGEDLSEIT